MRHNSFQKIYASYIAPNPEMDVLWMDLNADPYGSVIKFWNGGIDKYELISSDASTIGKHIIYADGIEKSTRSILNFKGFEISDNQPLDSMTISVENKEDAGVAQSIVYSHELEFNHSDIHHENRGALNSVSGINTGDQDLSGLVEKINGHSLVPDTEIDKLVEYPEFEDLEFSHENLTDKNSEAAFQHVDTTTTKETLDEADRVALWDSVTGKVVLTSKENFGGDNLIASYTHSGNKEVTVTAVDLATGVFTAMGHGLVNGDVIFPILNLGYLESTFGIIRPVPTGLLLQRYFVVEVTADTFKVSVASGGAAVTFTANANIDLTAWHFEKKSIHQVIISNITERNTRIVFTGWVFYPFLTITPSIDGSGFFGSKNTFTGSGTTVQGNGSSILTYEGYVHLVRDTRTDKRISSQFSGVIVKASTVSANTITALDARVVSLYYSDVAPTNVIVGFNAASNIMVNGTEIKIYKL